MSALPTNLDQIANADSRLFEAALGSVRDCMRTSAGPTWHDAIISCCKTIDESAVLHPREQERRVSVLLQSLAGDASLFGRLAEFAVGATPAVRNAIAKSIPSEFRQAAFGRAQQHPGQVATAAAVPVDSPGTDVSASPLASKAQVLLVGTLQEHDHNSRFLKQRGIASIRAATPKEVTALLADETVAVIIARSCWTALPVAEHEEFVKQICSFSSFALVKVDTTGFAPHIDFDMTCSLARCRNRGASAVTHGDSPNLTEADLSQLDRASQALDSDDPVHLYPADISPAVAKLLIAGVARRVDDRHFPRDVHLQRIGTETMQGGRSEALLVQAGCKSRCVEFASRGDGSFHPIHQAVGQPFES